MTALDDAKPSEFQRNVDAIPELAPVSASERIDVMDILRGFALIGVLLMNIEWFGRPIAELTTFDKNLLGLDHAVGWLIRCFVEGKFFKLFALLFGMGFGVMLLRARERGKPFTAWFSRRMAVLFAIGILHMVFLWSGDILHDYAFAGLLFLGLLCLFKRKRFQKFDNPRSLLKIGLIWLFLPSAISVIAGIGAGAAYDPNRLQTRWQEQQEILIEVKSLEQADDNTAESDQAAVTHDSGDPGEDGIPEIQPSGEIQSSASTSVQADQERATRDKFQETSAQDRSEEDMTPEEILAQKVKEKLKDRAKKKEKANVEINAYTEGSYWKATQFRVKDTLFRLMMTPLLSLFILLPIFLLGYWLISSGIMREHGKHTRLFSYMAWIGMGFGLTFTVGGLLVLQHPATEGLIVFLSIGMILFSTGQYLMAAGYLGLITCMIQSERWHRLLGKLTPLGRMALTNYIMQTVILTGIFHGYAGGMFGKISRTPQMLIVIAILIFQIHFSKWWLETYRFGPLEWAWRSLTYKKLQPMKIASQEKV